MQTIALSAGGIVTTRLGFGTAGLLREPSKRRRLDVLAAALDAGIRHFDTAPLYGFGESERLLGELLAARPEPVTIATKFGLAPSAVAARLAPVQALARAALKAFPALRGLARRRASRLHHAPRFDAASARTSLERSLVALRRDRVDVFLLHECSPEAVTDERLLACLHELRDRGRIRAFGTATTFDRTLAMLASRAGYCETVQLDSDALSQNVRRLPCGAGTAVIAHGALARAFAELRHMLRADAAACARWTAALDADVGDPAVLARLLLQAALDANPRGVVIVQSTSPRHVAANAASAASADPQQLARLADLLRAYSRRHASGAELAGLRPSAQPSGAPP